MSTEPQHQLLRRPVTPLCARRARGARDREGGLAAFLPPLAQRAADVPLRKGDPPAMALQGAQKSAPLRGRRSREMSPQPCSQPLPSSCPPTGRQKQLSTHSVLKRDDSGLDLATWGKKNFLKDNRSCHLLPTAYMKEGEPLWCKHETTES